MICGNEVHTLDSAFKAMFQNPERFYLEGIAKLMDRRAGCDFYGFLYSYGYKNFIDAQWDARSRE